MSDLFWLSKAQVGRLRPYFPKSRGKPQMDERRVLNGIFYRRRNELMWSHALRDYGSPKTVYNRWKRWSRMSVVAQHHDRTGGPSEGYRDGDDRRGPI